MQRDEWADTLAAVFESVTGNDTPEQSSPAFFVETDGGEQIVLSARGADGQRTQLSVCTPAEELLRVVEIDYTHLRDEVMRLWETYPLDGMERATQRGRYELLTSTYPSALDGYYPARRIAGEDDVPLNAAHVEYRVEELDELYRLLLTLYFSQGKQRIVRCECCFGYFIPKTSRPTIYCDRVLDGKRCKDAGPGLKYLAALDRNAALRIYDTLRHRRAAEYNAYMDQHSGVDAKAERAYMDEYEAWSAAASAARETYLEREIDAAEFLRRIGYDGEAELAEAEARGKSEWRERVERSIDFDPWMEYRGMMTLDLNAETLSWEITSAEEQAREARGEHRSLREKYGNK